MTQLRRAAPTSIPEDEPWQSLFDLSPTPQWVLDEETLRFVAVNEAALDLSGYGREQFLALSLSEFQPGEAPARPFEPLREGGPSRASLRRADGRMVVAELTARRFSFARRPARLVTATDLDPRLRLEQELEESRRSERRFRQLLEAASDWFWEADAEGRLTYISPNYESFSGLRIAEILGRRLSETQGVHVARDVARKVRAAIDARCPAYDFVYSHEFRPGEKTRWIHTNCILVCGDTGAVQGFRGASCDITPQVEAEEALRTSEQQFRQVLEAATDYYWEQDTQYRYSYISPGYEKLTGVPVARSLGKRLSEIPEISIDPEMGRMALKAIKAKQPYRDFLFSLRTPDGKTLRFTSSAAPIFDRDGEFRGYRGASAEITQQVEAVAAARLAQQRLDEAVLHVTQPVVVYDVAGRVVAFNQAFTDLHRAPNSNTPVCQGASFRDLADWQLRTGFYAPVEGDETVDLDRLVDHYHDGSERTYPLRDGRWMLVIYRRLPGDGRVGSWTDVTGIKRAEAQLRRSRQHLAQAQRVSGIGSAVYDSVTHEHEWSDELYRILGVQPGTVTPSFRTYLRFVHPEDRTTLLASQRAIVAGSLSRVPEYRIVRPDGGIRIVQREMGVLEDSGGRTVQVLYTFQDKTELRAAEERQRELERQLQHAQKLDALGTLAGGVAHDLNNTLVPVLALSKLVMRRLPEGSRERANLATIHEAGGRARDLVRQILAFCRKEGPTREHIDLAALLRDSLRIVRAGLPATIRIEEAIDEVPPLLGEAGLLHQVVLNLVVNAAQAIGEKMGTLSVSLRAGRARMPTGTGIEAVMPALLLSVADTGHGMDEATRRRIFEPFFTTKPVGEGTGLGLSVVYGIVAQHGGRIAVESRVGEGTRFDIFLPPLPDEAGQHQRDLAAAEA